MKRDMDLVRQLLLLLEQRESPAHIHAKDIQVENASVLEIQYHLNLMFQAGLIDGEPTKSSTSDRLISVTPFGLTWQGHEFLESVRDPEIWTKAKAGAAAAGTVGIEFLWAIAKALIASQIRSRTGLDVAL